LKGLACCALVGLVLAGLGGCHNGQVRLRRAPGEDAYVWQDPISEDECRAFYEALLYVVSPPVGYAAGRQQTVEGFILNAQLRWNDAVRPLGGLFEDLCKQHNEALTTLSEFQKRKARLTDAAAALTAQKTQLDAVIAEYRDAKQEESKYRGAENTDAAAKVAQARQRMDAASQTVERLIKEATALVDALKGPRAESRVMA
jgi:hypothetical protein